MEFPQKQHFFKHLLGLTVGSALIVASVGFFWQPNNVQAVTRTWDGGGVTENWSEDANWSGDVEPGASDIATFDGTSTKNATIDTTISVSGIDVNTGYTGTITQGAGNTVTVGSGNFDLAAGSFVGGAATMNLSGSSFGISSGATFTAPTTISTTGAGTAWNINASQTLNNLTTSHTVAFTLNSLDILVIDGTLTLNGGALNTSGAAGTGVFNVNGSIVQNSGSTAGSATVNFSNDSSAQTYTINGGTGVALNFDSASDASDSLVFAAAGGLFRLTTTAGFSGDIPISNSSNFAMTFQSWSQSGGSYTNNYCGGLCSTMNLGGGTTTFTIVSPATFTAPTTINATGTGTTWDVNSSQTVNNLTVNHTVQLIITSGDTIVTDGTLTLSGGSLNTGTLNANGNIVQNSGSASGSATLNFNNDSAAQTYTINGGTGPNLRLDSVADESDSLVFAAAGGLGTFTTTSGFTGTVPVTNSSNVTMTFGNWAQSGGTWSSSYCGGICANMAFTGSSFVVASPAVFTAPTTITTSGAGTTWNVNVSQTVNNISISHTVQLIITSGDTLVVDGNLTIGGGSINTGSLTVKGNVTQTGGGSISSVTTFSGSGTQVVTFATPSNQNGDVIVDKTGGQVTLASNYDLDAASQDLTIVEGTFDISGFNLNVEGTSGTFVVQDGGVFERYGAETLTLNSGLPTLQTGSTVRYTGDGDSAADTYTITSTYSNFTIASTDGTTDTFQLGAALDVNGNFSNSGTLSVTATNYQVNVAGNWTNTGTFVPFTGTVIFDGTNQTVSGTTTFYNWTKTVSSAATLTLPAGNTQTITGTMTLQGAAGQLLSLRSSTTGVRAITDPQGTRTVQYLDVKDQNNTNATAISCGVTCVNSGNNLRWFGAESTGGPGYIAPQPDRITVLFPNGGNTFQVGETMQLSWSTTGSAITKVDISLSRDDGSTYKTIVTQTPNDGAYSWVVTSPAAMTARIRLEGTDGTTVLNSDTSDSSFAIEGDSSTPVTPPSSTPPPETPSEPSALLDGELLKLATSPTVYMLTEGNILRPFFNATIFHIYEKDFSRVRTVTLEELSSHLLGSMMLPKPGTVLVKTMASSRVYAIQDNSANPRVPIIRWITTEPIAISIYGSHWADYVIDVDPVVLAAFVIGSDITSLEDTDIGSLRTRFELVVKQKLRELR